MTDKTYIIQFAALKFTQFGSKQFTMDELATLLGISKKTIYNSFSTKEDLVKECILYLIQDYNNTISYLTHTETDPITIVILMYEEAFERLRLFKPSFIFGLRKYYSSANKVFDDFREEFVNVKVYNLLKTALNQGILLKAINLELFCDLYFRKLEELAFLNDNLFEMYSNKALLNHFIVYSLRGITNSGYTNPYFK
ncbi:MAG: TetR/AcrR family transcriptional regulator [Xanthomarina gelatinilytica]|uniref:TetR/AcrR family transcriptional regulator n=1 Tax=Xanthomarina gelatinilytica TaxID=1137281 RepID=UPI003A8A42D3